MDLNPLVPDILFQVGPVPISRAVVTTWVIMALMSVFAVAALRSSPQEDGPMASVLEIVIDGIASQIEEIIGRDPWPYLPLLGSLFLFVALANLAAIVPGGSPPTGHIETPAALALIVFASVHYFGIQERGPKAYFRHYIQPNPLLLPLNVLSELTRTFSLMIRLFGNMMSHEFVIAIVLVLAGLFVPIPFMLLGILIGLVQAYIFTILATVYIGAAVSGQEG